MDIPTDIARLSQTLLRLAEDQDAMLATAESCTGGQMAAVLTAVEGLSHRFDRGFVSYTPEAKHELLGVPQELIEREGVVSRAVAQAMAQGCLNRSQALCGLSVTGFAGPAEPGEEPGLVHVACAIRDAGIWHRELHFGVDDRDQIRWDSIRAVLDLARDEMTQRGRAVAAATNG
jgi:nicotinamide-nucleotide amidase